MPTSPDTHQLPFPAPYLKLLISCGEIPALIRYLTCPRRIILPDGKTASRIKTDMETVLRALTGQADLRRLLQLHVVTSLLISGAPDPYFSDISSICPDYPMLVSGLPAENPASGKWIAVPLIGMDQGRACQRYWIAGLFPSCRTKRMEPAWVDGVMDAAARTGAADAASAAMNFSGMPENVQLAGYPLAIPNGRIQFRSHSLGLPIALGYCSLISSEPISPDTIATGALMPDGAVCPVESIREKARLARAIGCRLFIYPSASGMISGMGGMETAPAGSLEEAFLFAGLHAPGNLSRLILFDRMRNDPGLFLDACCTVDRNWLKWAKSRGHLKRVAAALTSAPVYLTQLVKNLGRLLSEGRLPDAVCLSGLVEEQMFHDMTERFPASAFRWAVLNLALCNHLGDTAGAAGWSAAAEKLIGTAAPKDLSDAAAYVNNHYIQLHHNHYVFLPELPDFVHAMRAILEKQHRVLCDGGFSIHRPIAELHGSIAQNYGFCGPRYLPQLERHVRSARHAFGSGDIPEMNADWQRQFNYLCYAYLDAGNTAAAESALFRYLGGKSWRDICTDLSAFSSWQHALLSRHIADAGSRDLKTTYLKWAACADGAGPHHPWQLWLLHLGKMAGSIGDDDSARRWYLKSVRHCLSGISGPTVQAMALMPLSRLMELPGTRPGDLADDIQRAQAAAAALNPAHFRPALSSNLPEAMKAVIDNETDLFPFSYR